MTCIKQSEREVLKSVYELYFQRRNVCTKQYKDANSKSKFSKIYEKISLESARKQYPMVTVVILTANFYEKNVFHSNYFTDYNQSISRFQVRLLSNVSDENEETYAYLLDWNGYKVLHIEAQRTGSYTFGGAADIVRYVMTEPLLHPSMIVSMGICFGCKEKENHLGDVVISEKVYPYFIGAKIKGSILWVSDDNIFRIKSSLRAKLKSDVFDRNLFSEKSLLNNKFEVHLGNYITGEAVISDRDIRNQFRGTTYQEILAGDMEGYGLFKECRSSNVVIPCLLVKSICDWGMLKNYTDEKLFCEVARDKHMTTSPGEINTVKDKLQALAAYNAYTVMKILLDQKIFVENSIYDDVVNFVKKNENENVIAYCRIEDLIKEYNHGIYRAESVSATCISSIAERMIEEKLITKNNKRGDSWKIIR